MPGYLVAVCQVTDPNENFKKYSVASAQLMAQYGGKYIVRGPAAEVTKGDMLKGQVVIVTEFPTLDDAQAFLNDEKYLNEVLPLREGTGIYNVAVYGGV
jgi:uncharacterized protein (DUF1330 family)